MYSDPRTAGPSQARAAAVAPGAESHRAGSDNSSDERAGPHEAVVFSSRGLRALDDLAAVLVHRMANTPAGIAYVLDHVLHAPVDELCDALQAVTDEIEERTYRADKPARAGVIYADGWRTQMPGSWPHYPDEPHHCYPVGHWTSDGRLVLACCGLDAT